MLLTLREFTAKVRGDIDGFVDQLQVHTSRRTPEEAKAWKSSFPRVVDTLEKAAPGDLHLVLGSAGRLAVEYKLPASSRWADLILLGKGATRPAAVIFELKHWETRGDLPGPAENLMVRHGERQLHPSDQVRGYVEYCRQFHSAVADHRADVQGCVLFTREPFFHAYKLAPNDRLVASHPCFYAGANEAERELRPFLARFLKEPDADFAEAFVKGRYRQARSFVHGIGEQLKRPTSNPFVLLDHQRRALAIVKERVLAAVARRGSKKSVVIVLGPPGSGKSVVAARTWAELVTEPTVPKGDLVVVTTSACQRTNWEELFEQAGGRGSSGVVVGATTFTPATTKEFGDLRDAYPDAFKTEEHWRENFACLKSLLPKFRDGARDDQYLVSLCDEAHALINPELKSGRGQHGFAGAFGPPGWHQIRCSKVAVFLLDPLQGFRDRENTTIDDLRRWAADFGADVEVVSLEDSQFRCGGSLRYMLTVDELLADAGQPGLPNFAPAQSAQSSPATHFYESAEETPLAVADRDPSGFRLPTLGNRFAPFEVHWCETPEDLDSQLRAKAAAGGSVRLLASYAREWKTKGVAKPHSLPPEHMDFHLRYQKNQQDRWWSRVWNYAPREDYTLFIQAPVGSPMARDPLCEVGCPYTVRGFDYDHIGLLWLEDLVWRSGSWVARPEACFETGFKNTTSAARKERNHLGAHHQRLLRALQASYRVLLTRAIRSLHLWCADQETRDHLRRTLY